MKLKFLMDNIHPNVIVFATLVAIVWWFIFGIGSGFFSFKDVQPLEEFAQPLGWLPAIALVGLGFILAEIFFLGGSDKPQRNQSVFWFTAKEKFLFLLAGFFVSFVVVGCGIFAYGVFLLLAANFGGIYSLLRLLGYWVVVGVVVLICFLAYVKFNTLKYRNLEFENPKKKRR